MESLMRKKAGRPLVKVNRRVHVIHLNVGSGYVTYLEEDVTDDNIRVKGISLEAPDRKKAAKN